MSTCHLLRDVSARHMQLAYHLMWTFTVRDPQSFYDFHIDNLPEVPLAPSVQGEVMRRLRQSGPDSYEYSHAATVRAHYLICLLAEDQSVGNYLCIQDQVQYDVPDYVFSVASFAPCCDRHGFEPDTFLGLYRSAYLLINTPQGHVGGHHFDYSLEGVRQ